MHEGGATWSKEAAGVPSASSSSGPAGYRRHRKTCISDDSDDSRKLVCGSVCVRVCGRESVEV